MSWRTALACGFMGAFLLGPATALADERRPGWSYMSPALQAMQRDDSLNPGQLWVREGEALWQRSPAGAPSCASCHRDERWKTAAARHPAWDAGSGRALTLAGRIDRCRSAHQSLAPQGAEGSEVLALAAWLAHQARGTPVAPPADDRMKPWRERGQTLWHQRLGQLNLACAQCHDDRAGQRLGGAAIPQGHPTGYPTYRLEWQALGSLQRRLRGCLVGVRAEPFVPSADEWVALEAWLMQRAAGMPLEGVAVRP